MLIKYGKYYVHFWENRYFTSLVKQNYYFPTWGANTK